MSCDRELMELAAKAAGLSINEYTGAPDEGNRYWAHGVNAHPETAAQWNPLTDDGDALRLAVTLRITVEQELLETKAAAYVLIGAKRQHFVSVSGQVTRQEATRRAIVRAAAEIGRSTP